MTFDPTRSYSTTEATAGLELFDCPAMIVGPHREVLAVNRHFQLSLGDGGVVVGRHCWEVSHNYSAPCDEQGEKCPLRLCEITGEPARVLHVHYTPHGPEHEEITAYPVVDAAGDTKAFLEIIRPSSIAAAQPSRRRMVGRSPAFNLMLQMMQRVAPRLTPILLLGETGTGKELVARAIHEMSPRSEKPFVPVDCSGLSETLFESELFGHERGAFTGASGRKIGLVEASTGGTLFLDEVGDIPLAQQVKLLRLLESGIFRRVGSVDMVKSDFRLVCATHRNLPELVAEGSFRKDLYFRLSVFPIAVPPLRERTGDLPLLAESVLRQVGCNPDKKVHPKTISLLERYPFPGNVRELRNLMERACLLAEGNMILPDHLPKGCCNGNSDRSDPASRGGEELLPLEEIERRYLAAAVRRFTGSHRELAAKLGVSERTLYRKLKDIRDGEAMPAQVH